MNRLLKERLVALCSGGLLSEQAPKAEAGLWGAGSRQEAGGEGWPHADCPFTHPLTVPSAVSSLTDDLLKYYQQVTRAVLGMIHS